MPSVQMSRQVRERKKKGNRRNDFQSRQRAHRSSSYLTSHYYARPPHPLQLVIPFVRLNDELIPDAGRHAGTSLDDLVSLRANNPFTYNNVFYTIEYIALDFFFFLEKVK